MIHARSDYMRIQDPAFHDPSLLSPGSTPIGEDEPVMLFRAQDRFFVSVLEQYRDWLLSCGRFSMAEMVRQHILAAQAWQKTHATKTPDVPAEIQP